MQPPPKGQFQAGVPVQQASGYDPKAQAIGNLGQAVKQSGDLALELQKEQDRQYLTDAEIIMRRESSRIANELATTMDPTQHYSKAKDKFDSVVDGILKKGDFRPSFQNELQGRLNMFTSAKLEKIAHDAKVMQLENGKMLHMAKANIFRADGDYEGERRVLDEGVGTYYPTEYAEARKLESKRMERNDYYDDQAAAGNPEYFDNKDLDGLSDADRQRYKNQAKRAKAGFENEALSKVSGDIAIGQIKTKADLEAALNSSPRISEASKAKMLSNWDKNTPISYKEKKSYLDSLNTLYKKFENEEISKDQYHEAHHQISSAVYAMGNRPGTGGLRQRVYALDPAKWRDGVPPKGGVTSKEMIADSILSDYRKHGGFGSIPKKENSDPLGMTMAEADIDFLMARVEEDLKVWLQDPKNAEAGRAEIAKEIERLTTVNLAEDGVESGFDVRKNFQDIVGDGSSGVLPSLPE